MVADEMTTVYTSLSLLVQTMRSSEPASGGSLGYFKLVSQFGASRQWVSYADGGRMRFEAVQWI